VLNVSGHSVSVLNATTGRVLRTVHLPYPIDAAVDDASGHVFVLHGGCGTAYRAAMLDARSGRVLHAAQLASAPLGLVIDAGVRRVLIAESGSNAIILLDTTSGRVVRTVAVGAIPGAVALDTATDHAFVTNRGDNTVSVLDVRLGAVLRTVAVGQDPTSVAVDSRTERVFVVNAGEDTVSVLDAGTGRRLRTVSLEGERVQGLSTASNPVDLAVDVRRDRIFVLNGGRSTGTPTRGSVSVLDARSGAVQRTIPVGLFPQGEALDEAGARLFVVNQVGDSPRGLPTWGWLPTGLRPWLRWLVPPSVSNARGTVSVLDTAGL
jgi:YVTN family beta-propeller protein